MKNLKSLRLSSIPQFSDGVNDLIEAIKMLKSLILQAYGSQYMVQILRIHIVM